MYLTRYEKELVKTLKEKYDKGQKLSFNESMSLINLYGRVYGPRQGGELAMICKLMEVPEEDNTLDYFKEVITNFNDNGILPDMNNFDEVYADYYNKEVSYSGDCIKCFKNKLRKIMKETYEV
jgi:hypothetical protein